MQKCAGAKVKDGTFYEAGQRVAAGVSGAPRIIRLLRSLCDNASLCFCLSDDKEPKKNPPEASAVTYCETRRGNTGESDSTQA